MKTEYPVTTIDNEPEKISKEEAYRLFTEIRRDLYDEDVENEFYERCREDDIDLDDVPDEKIAEALKPLQDAYAKGREDGNDDWEDLLAYLMNEDDDENCHYETILAKLGIDPEYYD